MCVLYSWRRRRCLFVCVRDDAQKHVFARKSAFCESNTTQRTPSIVGALKKSLESFNGVLPVCFGSGGEGEGGRTHHSPLLLQPRTCKDVAGLYRTQTGRSSSRVRKQQRPRNGVSF